ncbi:hypothetical protein MHBO_004537 [Bonamia ostreae]|uniref:Uncharacterized protein n=1 Tax=Bonamia ostreae TaxID=126728 RepID=A0ABV2ATR2_9EUKA
MLKKLLLVAGAAIGGIYLTSEEGKSARESLLKKKSAFEPIVKDLLKQTNEILEGSKNIDSKEVKANIDLLVNQAKQSLIDLDLDKTSETIKDAIRVASKQIRKAVNESEKELKNSKKKVVAKKMQVKTRKTQPVKKATVKKAK